MPLTARCFLPHRVLSALAHWSAIFGETEYLPLLAFPFVKLFQNNPLVCFEVTATVIGACRCPESQPDNQLRCSVTLLSAAFCLSQ